MSQQKKKTSRSPLKMLLRVVLIALLAIVLAVAGLLLFLSVTEFKPAAVEELEITGASSDTLKEGDDLQIVTWNIGYGALGDNADFFMDGGSMVNTATEARVNENLSAIVSEIEDLDADLYLLQEVDVDSARSHHINEAAQLQSLEGYAGTFANNFKTAFIPYPIPPIGKVDSGILTLSRYEIDSAERISLPVPFSWPISMANLKRCLNVSVIPLEDSDRNLILVNLHLEAYDDGEGKKAQTEQLKTLLEEASGRGDYVIAGGDFNQVFSGVDLSAYPVLDGMWQPGLIDESDFDSSLQFVMDASVPTCRSLDRALETAESREPEDFQYYMIDGFIVSENIGIRSVETQNLGFVNSDHNPVVMEVTLK